MAWESFFQQLMRLPLLRRVAESRLRGRARRLLVELDDEPASQSQSRILGSLIHRARRTRFGVDHDFGRITTTQDFRRLVPLRTLSDLARDYWPSTSARLDNTTWPWLPYRAFARGFSDPFAEIPVAQDLLASHGRAALTALGLVLKARPQAPVLAGPIVVVGDQSPERVVPGSFVGSLEDLAFERTPALVKPFFEGPLDLKLAGDERADRMVRSLLRVPVTCIAGTSPRLAQLIGRLRKVSGKERLVDAWPGLAAVFHSRIPNSADNPPLRIALGGRGVLALEVCFRPEGAIAIEDPRYGLLRLLADHGIYFEFVPLRELNRAEPARHGLAEVEIGVPYAVALTSPGIWACLTDIRVCFESREPPLLRLLDESGSLSSSPLAI